MNNQKIKLANVKKSCKAAKIVSTVLTVILALGFAAAAAGASVVFILADKVNEAIAQNTVSLDVTNPEIHGFLQLKIDLEGMVAAGNYAQAVGTACVFGAIVCLVLAIVFVIITRTFVKLEKSETPFAPSILRSIKAAFIMLTIFVAAVEGIGNGLIAGLIFWSVYCIMDYGCALQEEMDETV